MLTDPPALHPPLMEVDLPLRRYNQGKVRDTFEIDGRLLMVASDRISAFDVVMPTGIPDKGVILTQMSLWWFAQLSGICPNHLCDGDWPEPASAQRDALEPRSMLVRKAERIDIECVVRGYLAGSGWAEYSQAGTLAGLRLPAGLRESERLPHAQFTPATKNDLGHDQNISIQEMADRVGTELTIELQTKSIDLYNHAAVTALERGVILADTKLEFGYIDGELSLIDECFTPDSSRYWDAEMYEPGVPQPSMDKQFLRDWLDGLDWNKQPPAPRLPDEVVSGTRQRYLLAYKRITGGGL